MKPVCSIASNSIAVFDSSNTGSSPTPIAGAASSPSCTTGFGIAVLLLWTKCNPQLISLDAGHSHRAATVPYATTCVHPFDASLINDSFGTGGFQIRQLSLKDGRHCLDPGMWMKANRPHSFRVDIKVVQKYEWLSGLADVGVADKPCNWTLRRAAHSKNDFAPFDFSSLLMRALAFLNSLSLSESAFDFMSARQPALERPAGQLLSCD